MVRKIFIICFQYPEIGGYSSGTQLSFPNSILSWYLSKNCLAIMAAAQFCNHGTKFNYYIWQLSLTSLRASQGYWIPSKMCSNKSGLRMFPENMVLFFYQLSPRVRDYCFHVYGPGCVTISSHRSLCSSIRVPERFRIGGMY